MNIEVVGIIVFICVVVVGVYVIIFIKRKRCRVDFFFGIGFLKLSLGESRCFVE